MHAIKCRVLFFSVLISLVCSDGNENSFENLPALNETVYDRLRQHLFLNYDKLSRPDEYWNKTVVFIHFDVHHVKLDDSRSIVSVTGVFISYYKDRKLKWDKSKYDGANKIYVEDHETWSPDIHLFNSANCGMQNYGKARKAVYSNGLVLSMPWTTFRGYCQLDFTLWPFERNKCSLMLGSWTYHANEVELAFVKNHGILMSNYTPNDEWAVESTDISRRLIHYSCCKKPFLVLNFDFHLKRAANLYNYIITAPTVPIAFLALSIFWLDPQSKVKLIINGFQLAYISLFLLYLGSKIPAEIYSIPVIVRFYSGCAYQVTISAILSIFVINFAERPNLSLPNIIKTLLMGHIGRYLGLCDIIAKIEAQRLSREMMKSENQDFNATTKEKKQIPLELILFTTAIDRVSFLFFCGMFSIMAIYFK